MIYTKIIVALAFVLSVIACQQTSDTTDSTTPKPITQETISTPTNQVFLASDIQWTPLNPARGDQSPQAGTLWGDRSKEVPTGFLVKFVKGFSSPPHIHNVTYRGVVIKGLIHNDDPTAEKMWMPAGSFWTQPAGEAHITAAKSEENMAFIEIDHGPYLVKPTEKAFDNGERPINIDCSNIVWTEQVGITNAGNTSKIAYLWGQPQTGESYGTLLKLPAGFKGVIKSEGAIFRAVITEGQLSYQMPNTTESQTLAVGSHFSSEGKAVHQLSTDQETILYVRTNGKYAATPTK